MSRLAAVIMLAVAVGCGPPSSEGPGGDTPHLNLAAIEVCTPLLKHDFAFTSSASGNSEIYLYDAAGRDVRKLTEHPAPDHWAAWAPDGSRFAFQSLRDGNREIYTQDADGSNLENLTGDAEQDLLPAWSPDGGRIAFFSSRAVTWDGDGPLGGHIFTSKPDGTDLRQLPLDPFVSTPGISWSRDSKRLAYPRYREGANGLYIFDLGSGTETQVPMDDDAGSVGGAAYSPTTNEIAFYRSTDDGSEVYIVPEFGGIARRVTSGSRYHYDAAWSPDGTALLVTSSPDGGVCDIRCVAVDGSYNVAVIDGGIDARTAAWRPAP